jgi:hypothetical protein
MGLFDNANPFHRTVLHDRDLFSGERHIHILTRIKNILKRTANSNQSRNFIISGDRGVGKSSLLSILSSEAEDYNSVSIDILLTDQVASNEWEFFYLLFKETISSIEKNIDEDDFIEYNNNLLNMDQNNNSRRLKFIDSYYTKRNLPDSVLPPNEIIGDFKRILECLRTVEKQEMLKLTFCIDEAQKIYDKRDIIQLIREIIEKEIGVSFILVGEEPKNDDELDKVFGGMSRGFEVEKLRYFRELSDMKDFFETSLKKIGWNNKDIERRGIHKYEKTLLKIGSLTNGKPDFIVDIASRMYEQGCEIGKMKLSDTILDNITRQIEKSTNIENFNINNQDIELDFNSNRANYILKLNSNKRLWVKFLISNSLGAPLRIIYSLYQMHFAKDELIKYDEFLNFFKELENENIFTSLYKKPEELTSKLGFNQNKEDKQNNDNHFERFPFIYRGNFDELKWLSIKSEIIHSERFNFETRKHIYLDILDTIEDKCGFGSRNSFVRYSHKNFKILNSNGIIESSNIEEINFPKFLKSISNKKIDINTLQDIDNKEQLEYVYKVFDLASTEKKDIEMLTIHIFLKQTGAKIQKTINQLYNETPSYKIKKPILKYLKDNAARNEDVDFDFKIEQLEIDQFPNISNLNEIILTNNISLEAQNKVINSAINKIVNSFTEEEFDFTLEEKNIILLVNKAKVIPLANLYNRYNGLAYILIASKKYKIAEELLEKLYLDFSLGKILKEDLDATPYIIYNNAIIDYYNNRYELSKQKFHEAIKFIKEKEIEGLEAGYLLKLTSKRKIDSVKNKNQEIDFIQYCNENISIIDSL